MRLILDAGALIAHERGGERTRLAIANASGVGPSPLTHGGIVGQAWRSPRQVRLARLLRGVEVRPVDAALGRDAGLILAAAGTTDVLDAALVALANDGDVILTSDPGDIARLAEAAHVSVDIVRV